MNAPPPASSDPASEPRVKPMVPVVDVRQLLGEGREVVLMHLGEAYRLRVTARDRLILTK